MPSAVALTGVPAGALISTPVWNYVPSPENGSVRRPNAPINRPFTGHTLGVDTILMRAAYRLCSASVLALRKRNLPVAVVRDAIKAISAEEGRKAIEEMVAAHAHQHRRRMPARGDEAARRRARGLFVNMEGLRIELARKRDDVVGRNVEPAVFGDLAGRKVLEIESVRHGSQLAKERR